MIENEIHLKLSEIVIDNDNLDYIKATGEICGKLRWDLVKLFAIPIVVGQSEQLKAFAEFCMDNYSLEIPDRIIKDYEQSL